MKPRIIEKSLDIIKSIVDTIRKDVTLKSLLQKDPELSAIILTSIAITGFIAIEHEECSRENRNGDAHNNSILNSISG